MTTRKPLSQLTKQKRADRRKAKKNAPCPHDWANAEGGGTVPVPIVCRICKVPASVVVR